MSQPLRPDEIMTTLGLHPLPNEGGLYVETYRSSVSTAIYYLLTDTAFSAMHRLPGDEMYHHYDGDPVEMLLLSPDGTGEVRILGTDLRAGMRPQIVVPGGVWQGSRIIAGGHFALLGTTMAPGFEFAYYEVGDRAQLCSMYPTFQKHIQQRIHL